MTIRQQTCKIIRTWYSVCSAYPTADEDQLARITANRCRVSKATVWAALASPADFG